MSDEALRLIRAQGFTWAASDESVLRGALAARDPQALDWPAARCRPYRVETAAGPLAMVFRNRTLSDRIGFVYQRWSAVDAAEDFIEQIRSEAAHARGSGPALVTVILDGENCWEGYEEDGRPFLEALYERLETHPSIEAVTVSSALEWMAPTETLRHVPVGSWIRDDLAIWIGHAEKNAAWSALRDARALLTARGGAAPAGAWDAIYAAEGSDWFWWYGDDHESDHRDVFDALFRGHLLGVYAALEVEPPAALRKSLRAVDPEDAGADEDGPAWASAARVDAVGGAAHRVTAVVKRLRYRVDGVDLAIRIRLEPNAAVEGTSLVFRFGSGGAASIPLDGPRRGSPSWEGPPPEDPGTFALGDAIDVRIPLAAIAAEPGGGRTWRLEMRRGEAIEERLPGEGALALPAPAESPHA